MPKNYFGWCESCYRKKLAVGQPDIKADEIVFRFRDEIFAFPTKSVALDCTADGSFYIISIAKLRALKRSLEKAHG